MLSCVCSILISVNDVRVKIKHLLRSFCYYNLIIRGPSRRNFWVRFLIEKGAGPVALYR